MADPKGFLKVTERELPKRRPVPVRIMDWKEVYEQGDPAHDRHLHPGELRLRGAQDRDRGVRDRRREQQPDADADCRRHEGHGAVLE